MAFQINGPNGGNGLIFGNTAGDDEINAFDFNNVIDSEGANDQIFTGSGSATVNLGAFPGVTDTVNVGGAFNTVTTNGDAGASTLTVQGGSGNNVVTLRNSLGFNTVALQGFYNTITVNSNATNIILTGAGHGKVTAGSINDGSTGFTTSVVAAGQNNSIVGGDQNFTIAGGQGSDFISIGNGNNLITEAGAKDKITVGTGSNTVTDFGGEATIIFNGLVTFPPGATEIVNIGGTNNIVTETLAAAGSDRDFTITGGTGNGRFTLGNGIDVITTSGANNVIKAGTPDHGVPGQGDAVTVTNDESSSITLGNGNNKVTANGDGDTIALGSGNNLVAANGAHDGITSGDGANSITSNGSADTIKVGNGSNTLQASGNSDSITAGNGNNTITANGNTDAITAGNGNNTITADGNGDTILLGTGNNTVSATGSNYSITSAGGKGAFTLGSQFVTGQDTLTLNASAAGTTVDSEGTENNIVLNNNADASIYDSPFGGGLTLTIDASGGANAGTLKLAGFGADTSGVIDLQGFTAITNDAQLAAHSGSDGAGGTLIHLGTGSLDLLHTTISNTQFAFS
jgi:hypothetical protein